MLLNAANGKDAVITEAVSKYFSEKIDLSRLKLQLSMLSDAVQVKKVTSMRTIVDTLKESKVVRDMLGEVDKLLRAYLTFPVTSATAERSFSSLCRIKTFLRSTMTHQRLNNLFLLYVHTQLTDTLEVSSVAQDFISVNPHRFNYFGDFLQ